LEARLLARQDSATIAKTLCTTPEAVDWYEALCYNVRDRLDNRDWITTQCLLPALRCHPNTIGHHVSSLATGLPTSSVTAYPFLDGSVKLFAYFGGANLVDVMIHGFRIDKPVPSMDGIDDWLDKHWSTTMRRRSGQAAFPRHPGITRRARQPEMVDHG
jgi:hypothetical protein